MSAPAKTSDGKRVRRRTIQKTDKSMWSLWEKSHGQFSVVQKIWKLGSWHMCKNMGATARLAMHFVCSKCKGIIEGIVDLIEKLCDEVETVNGFCYLGDRLNFSGGCEAGVTARIRIGWVRFRECGKLLLGNRFPLRMKGKIYRSCIRSAILYGSEAWCLNENKKAILRRMERAMVRAMCDQKVVDRKTTEEQMDMLGLRETIYRLATANEVR